MNINSSSAPVAVVNSTAMPSYSALATDTPTALENSPEDDLVGEKRSAESSPLGPDAKRMKTSSESDQVSAD